MKKLLWLLLLSAAAAQNTVTVVASHIHDGTPMGLLPAGTILFQATDSNGKNIAYQIGGTGPSFTSPTICAITNGAITGPACTLPNVSLASPQNFCFTVTVKNSSNVVVLGGPGTPYKCAQPVANSSWCAASTCNFDNFFPTIPNSVYVLFLPPPAPNSLGGIYSGTCGSNQVATGYDVYGHPVCVASSGSGGASWGTITGTLANQTDLYTYLQTLAPLASPSFTGIPSVPTPLLSDNSTTVPNTSWIQSQGYAPLASPTFTGVPRVPTPATNISDTTAVNAAWVLAQGYSSGTGNVSGPGSSTLNDIALFGGTNGRSIIDAGFGFPLAASHLGTLSAGSNGLVNSATIDTTNAANISSGTLPAARLPNPTTSSLGGVQAYNAVSHQWLNSLATTGIFSGSQPACGDLSNSAPSCATDATNASNITSGTMNEARVGAGYPLNFTASLTGSWGTSGSPILFGTNRSFWQIGDYGTSPVLGAFYATDVGTNASDTTTNFLFDTGASPVSRHTPLAAAIEGVMQFQVCWQPGPQGKTMIGSVLTCAAESTTPFAKMTIATSAASGSASHTDLRLYAASTAYTGTMLEMNNATLSGAGFNFFKACAGASAGNGGCLSGGTVVASLDGTGTFSGAFSGNVTGNLNGNITTFPSPQIFPVTASVSDLVLGITATNPCCSLAAGSIWMQSPSLNGNDHIVYYDTSGGYPVVLTNGDTPANMSNGVTGTGATVLANSPVFSGTPNIGNATGISLTLSSTTGDNMDLQSGTVTPFIQASPASGHIKTGYGSDGTFKLSNGSATDNAFYSVSQTVAKGTASMTTAAIAGGACGTTVTVAAAGVLTTDVVEANPNAAATAANGGLLKLNAWPTSGNVNFNYCNGGTVSNTPTATTINWRVPR